MTFFFFNDTATTEIYTLSLHDALPISPTAGPGQPGSSARAAARLPTRRPTCGSACAGSRSEEHTSELQSRSDLVCRLLLEKKKNPYGSAGTLLGNDQRQMQRAGTLCEV